MANPQEVHVSVVVDSVAPLAFHFETTDLPMGPNNVLHFRNCRQDQGFHIFYELVGASGYRFPPDLRDALYVSQGPKSNCPTTAQTWGQFDPLLVLDGNGPGMERRILKVWNKNNTRSEFAYTLRITDGANWLPLDPGGENYNRGMPLQSYLLKAGGVTGAIVGIGTSALANSALVPMDALTYGIGGAVVGLIVGFVLDRL
jgi:hypothetical protein